MRKIGEVLRLRLRFSAGSIQNILKLAVQQGLSWSLPDDLDDQALALRLYPSSDARLSAKFQQPV